MATAYECLKGTVAHVHGNSRFSAAIQLEGRSEVIELHSEDYWVLRKGERAAFVGWRDPRSGKFFARAYLNRSRNVFACEGLWRSGGAVAALILPVLLSAAGAILTGFLPVWGMVLLFGWMLWNCVSGLVEDIRFQKAVRAFGIAARAPEAAK